MVLYHFKSLWFGYAEMIIGSRSYVVLYIIREFSYCDIEAVQIGQHWSISEF